MIEIMLCNDELISCWRSELTSAELCLCTCYNRLNQTSILLHFNYIIVHLNFSFKSLLFQFLHARNTWKKENFYSVKKYNTKKRGRQKEASKIKERGMKILSLSKHWGWSKININRAFLRSFKRKYCRNSGKINDE